MHSHWKWVWAENKNMVNLKSASFVVIMLLHEGLTHKHSQKKALVAFWWEFYFKVCVLFPLPLSPVFMPPVRAFVLCASFFWFHCLLFFSCLDVSCTLLKLLFVFFAHSLAFGSFPLEPKTFTKVLSVPKPSQGWSIPWILVSSNKCLERQSCWESGKQFQMCVHVRKSCGLYFVTLSQIALILLWP